MQASVELFEGMIVSEGKRLQAEGKDGLIILPGVQDLLSSVRILLPSPRPLSVATARPIARLRLRLRLTWLAQRKRSPYLDHRHIRHAPIRICRPPYRRYPRSCHLHHRGRRHAWQAAPGAVFDGRQGVGCGYQGL